ncbi:MAG: DODA-type extradiol aromatic ring-opening family dioxygenase [Alphaproteobacteria bacterium]|jgi:aromatic ring-opening dioxygenase catalytic subunit (LigB family)
MAKLVGSFAAGHAPNVARLWDTMSGESREWLTSHYDEMGRRLKALEPDVLIIHSTDHWVNFFLDNMPAFCVGIGAEHGGPPEPFMKPVFPHDALAGHADLGRHIVEYALEADFDPSYSMQLKLDHGMCVPVWRMELDPMPAIVPVFMNLVEKPFPTPKRCLAWGHMLRDAIEAYPEDLRVAVLGTGGLSHSIGETTMGWVDEPFDHACIELFKSASDEKFAADLTEMLEKTGNGGAELRAWIVAHAVAGSQGFDLIGYAPMPDMLIGCGVAEWTVAA